jgi:hypothetical protein
VIYILRRAYIVTSGDAKMAAQANGFGLNLMRRYYLQALCQFIFIIDEFGRTSNI